MAMLASEVRDWLFTLGRDATVAIDEGGLCLVEVGNEDESYCEVGGVPLPMTLCRTCGGAYDEAEDGSTETQCADCIAEGKTVEVVPESEGDYRG